MKTLNASSNHSFRTLDRFKQSKGHSSENIVVHSVFYTIQGEGPYAGYPAVFVRLAGCNLGAKTDFCRFCDTAFDPNDPSTIVESINSLIYRMTEVAGGSLTDKLIVITGGEPLLQRAQLEELIQQLPGHEIQIETNGMYLSSFKYPMLCVVSPKASEVTKTYPLIYNAEMLRNALAVKFLISADPNSPYHKVPNWAKNLSKQVYVSPIAVYTKERDLPSLWDLNTLDVEATKNNYAYAARYVMDNPEYAISIQTHLLYNLP